MDLGMDLEQEEPFVEVEQEEEEGEGETLGDIAEFLEATAPRPPESAASRPSLPSGLSLAR